MATVAPMLLRAARTASRAAATASRTARAAAAASRSARAAAAAARAAHLGSGETSPLKMCPTLGDASTKRRDVAPRPYLDSDDLDDLPDDAITPTDKDLESDEATWAFYERWCKAFNKERDHEEKVPRFKLFKHHAHYVHHWNTRLPLDPEEADIYIKKREQVKSLLSKGKDISQFEDWYLPMELGPFADGGDPVITENERLLLMEIEERERLSAVVCVSAG